MEIISSEIVQNFKPIRIEIECRIASDMDNIYKILEIAQGGPLSKAQHEIVAKLKPHFLRL